MAICRQREWRGRWIEERRNNSRSHECDVISAVEISCMFICNSQRLDRWPSGLRRVTQVILLLLVDYNAKCIHVS